MKKILMSVISLFCVTFLQAQLIEEVTSPIPYFNGVYSDGSAYYTNAGGTIGSTGSYPIRIHTGVDNGYFTMPIEPSPTPDAVEIVKVFIKLNVTNLSGGKVDIYAGTTGYSDYGQAFNSSSSMTLIAQKTTADNNELEVTGSAFTTISNWLDDSGVNQKNIYFTFKQNDETKYAYLGACSLHVQYRYKHNIRVSVNSTFDQSIGTVTGSLSYGGLAQSITSAQNDFTFYRNETINFNLNPTASIGSQQYAYSNSVLGGTVNKPEKQYSFNMPEYTTCSITYVPGVVITLDNKVHFLTGTESRIDGSTLKASKSGIDIATVSAGNSVVVPQSENINYTTLYGNNGENLTYQTSYKIKHQNWNISTANSKLTLTEQATGTKTNTAWYHELQPATIKLSFDGILQNNIPMQFKDPWRVVSGTQPGNWDNYNSGTNLGIGNDGSTVAGVMQNVIYDQLNPNNAHYRVKTDATKTFGTTPANFYNWVSANATVYSQTSTETPVKFNASNAIVTAQYKGHLRTGRPDLADTKNQRRALSSSNNNSWVMVYESMGNVYISFSNDGGTTWINDIRLNVQDGAASNPTISNLLLYNGSKPCYMVAWLETVSGTTLLHFQTIQLYGNGSTMYWGWKYYPDNGQDVTNHKTLNQISLGSSGGGTGFYSLQSDARPVVYLTQSGSTIKTYFAYEGTDARLKTAYMITTTDLNDTYIPLLGLGIPYVQTASTYYGLYPVIITYPSTFGFPAKTLLYFLSGGYAAGRRIAYYDYDSRTESVLANPNNDYTYWSLQGAVSPGNGSYVLSAEAQQNGGAHAVNYYYKPTYMGGSAPMLSTVFSLMSQPGIMCDQSSSFGSSPNGALVMKSTSDNNFYQYSGALSQISSNANVAGVFSKEQVTSGDRTSIVIKTSSSPATLLKYSGSGLAKSSGNIPTNSKQVRLWSDGKGNVHRIELDFRDAIVETIDSLETGNSLFAVKAEQWPGTIAVQNDSFNTPLEITLLRNGKRIQSYQPFAWKSISSSDIPGITSGDILLFTVGSGSKTASFRVVEIQDGSFQKGGLSSNLLIPTEKNIAIFPNPFNPTTTFRVSLPEPTNVRLSVYNMLGQHVATVVDGEVQAGHNDFRFNGSSLSSGIYFYRLEMGKEVKSGKLMLLK